MAYGENEVPAAYRQAGIAVPSGVGLMTQPGLQLRAGLYERVSDPRKAKGSREARSVAEQNTQNKAACGQHGWVIAARYADPGVSASRYARQKRREEYERLRADVTDGRLDVLVFWMVNRADRKLGEWAALLDECRERGVLIFITSGDRLFDPRNHSDWSQLASEGVKAASDSDVISTNVRRGMVANLQDGKPHGVTPYGFIRHYDENREIIAQVVHPETGPVRREVVQRVADGEPYNAIRVDLNSRGLTAPRGGVWTDTSIRRLVLSPANIAKRCYDPDHTGGGVLTDGADWWEPLIDEETWWRAVKRLKASRPNNLRPGLAGHRYLVSYFACCSKCGSTVCCRPPRPSDKSPLYMCKEHGCVAIRQDWLEEYVSGATCALIDHPAFWSVLLSGDKAASAATAEEEMLRDRLAEHARLSAAGKISPELLAEVEAELRPKIEAAARRADQTTVIPSALLDLRHTQGMEATQAIWCSWPLVKRKAIVRAIWSRIELHPAATIGKVTQFDQRRVTMIPVPNLAKVTAA